MSTASSTAQKIADMAAALEKEAYQRGWDDAVAKIVEAASQGTSISKPTKPKTKQAAKPFTSQYKTPIIDMVLTIVREKPDQRGVDIVKEVTARDPAIPFEVADRTGRTSLSRLQKRGLIVKTAKGTWAPINQGGDATAANS